MGTGFSPLTKKQIGLTLSYSNLEKENSDLLETLRNILNEQDKRVLNRFDDTELDLGCIRELAWFHLGFATAMRLLETPPAIKLIDGGRQDQPKLKSEFKL